MNSENKAKKMVVTIMGKSLNIKSTDSKEYVDRISCTINKKIEFVREHSPKLSQIETIILASLYVADDLEKTKDKIITEDKKATSEDIKKLLDYLSSEEEKYDVLMKKLSSIVESRKNERIDINNLVDKIEAKTDINKDSEIEALKETLKERDLEILELKHSFEHKIKTMEESLKQKEEELLKEKENMYFDEQKDRKIKELEEILALRESEIKDYMDFFDEMESKDKSEYIYKNDLEN